MDSTMGEVSMMHGRGAWPEGVVQCRQQRDAVKAAMPMMH